VQDLTVKTMSKLHSIAYRATGGMIGRRLVGNDMLLLTTKGAKTGSDHTVPLLYLRDGHRLIVVASYGGRPHHPQWYLNLVANPRAAVRIGRSVERVEASTMGSDDRARWWPRVVEAFGDYATYQSRTEREIPLVWLERTNQARR
jgi:deazaflavin-dependent oxidoreductase (nitroreductase family)